MLLSVRLTEKVEYKLPIDNGATAVIKVGLMMKSQNPVTKSHIKKETSTFCQSLLMSLKAGFTISGRSTSSTFGPTRTMGPYFS